MTNDEKESNDPNITHIKRLQIRKYGVYYCTRCGCIEFTEHWIEDIFLYAECDRCNFWWANQN